MASATARSSLTPGSRAAPGGVGSAWRATSLARGIARAGPGYRWRLAPCCETTPAHRRAWPPSARSGSKAARSADVRSLSPTTRSETHATSVLFATSPTPDEWAGVLVRIRRCTACYQHAAPRAAVSGTSCTSGANPGACKTSSAASATPQTSASDTSRWWWSLELSYGLDVYYSQ
jgi:hypothetical protein